MSPQQAIDIATLSLALSSNYLLLIWQSCSLQAKFQVLGVKARETGRATTQGSFIKSGCPEAVITISLWNEGPDAYLPEIYGDEIVVERRITQRSSQFTIRGANGKKVGTRRSDLDAILETLSINAANPIAVMTQVSCLHTPCKASSQKLLTFFILFKN